jgi:outer membrane protein assembly factor BamB
MLTVSSKLTANGILIVTAMAMALIASGCGRRVNRVAEVSASSSGVTVSEMPNKVDLAKDWPWWRGPNGNGVATSKQALTEWAEDKGILWKAMIPGRGHSSPIVVGNQVFVATAIEESQQQIVVAFDRKTGKENWQSVIHSGSFPSDRDLHRKSTHANGTIACDGERLYCAFLNGGSIVVSCLDIAGKPVWSQDLGAFDSKFGYAPSPLLYKSLVIVATDNQGGGSVAALDRLTGKIAWRKSRPAVSTYSSPVVANVAGRDQLLLSGCGKVSSFDPTTGDELWSCSGTAEATCGTVVWNNDCVFASGGYPEKQTLCVKADGSKEIVWSNATRCYEPSMILAKELLFAVTDDGIATCWDPATGKQNWKQRLGGNFSASPVACGDSIYVCADNGTTTVFKASATGLEVIAKNNLGDDCFASPAICDEQIFLRVGEQQSGKRQEVLYCIGKIAKK